MDKREELRKIALELARFLKEKYIAKRIFLIGSVARGDVHKRSDIDIVVEGLPPELYIKALTGAYDILPPGVELNLIPFELIPFEDAFESLKKKAVEKGELIYG